MSSQAPRKTNRILPIPHLSKVDMPEKPSESARTAHIERMNKLHQAGNLDVFLREYLSERGIEAPKSKNLALLAVEEFRSLVKDAQAVRKAIRLSQEHEQIKMLPSYAELLGQIKEYLDLGPIFEKSYREYISERQQFRKFAKVFARYHELERALYTSNLHADEAKNTLSIDEQSRVLTTLNNVPEQSKAVVDLATIETIFEASSPAASQLLRKTSEHPTGKLTQHNTGQLVKLCEETKSEALQLWQNPMVRYFWQRAELDKRLADIHTGKPVIEDQLTLERLNKLSQLERSHTNTTVGAVLVGPPGTGKTTIIRHYLEKLRRPYVYIDLSEDVTRYLLLGSKDLTISDDPQHHKNLAQQIKDLSDEDLRKFIETHADTLKTSATLGKDAPLILAINQLLEALEIPNVDPKISEQLASARIRLSDFVNKAYQKELATSFSHLVSKNGWRDGVVIAALRSDASIIFDEFVHFKQWHTLNSLLTAKPGDRWYFADHNEWLDIPADWRVYLTANIGTRHGGYTVPEKMASRIAGMVMEIGFPDAQTELTNAIGKVSTLQGKPLLNSQELTMLAILIKDAFPRIRALISNEQNTIPISHRTINSICEKIVQLTDPVSNKPVYIRHDYTVNQAIFDVLIGSYNVYERTKVPNEIVNILTSMGLLLDDSVKTLVLKHISEVEFEDRRKMYTEAFNDFKKVEATLGGLSEDMTTMDLLANSLPTVFNY